MRVLFSRYDASRGVRLPDFNPTSTCPKCRCDDVSARHQPDGCSKDDCHVSACAAEHIVRTCQRCHFAWPEAVLS